MSPPAPREITTLRIAICARLLSYDLAVSSITSPSLAGVGRFYLHAIEVRKFYRVVMNVTEPLNGSR